MNRPPHSAVCGVSTPLGCRRLILAGILVLLELILHPIGPARAQILPGVPAPGSERPAEQPADARTARQDLRSELEALLARLEDPEQARELAASVRALLAAMEAEGALGETKAAPADAPLADVAPVQDALSSARPAAAEWLARTQQDVSRRTASVREAADRLVETLERVPILFLWFESLLDEPAEWRVFARAATATIAMVAAGLAAMWLVARALAPARRVLVFREDDRWLPRAVMAALLVLLRATPVAVFVLAVNALVPIVQPDPVTRTWLNAIVGAIVIVRLGVLLMEAVLSPAAARARLLPVSDATARLVTTYAHWLLALGVYGFALAAVLRWQGMPPLLHGTLERLIAFALLISAIWMVMRRRRAVAEAISRLAEGADPSDAFRIPWRRIAAIWQIFAIIYLCALFVIYANAGAIVFFDVLTSSAISLALVAALVFALRYLEGKAGGVEKSLPKDDASEAAEDDPEPVAGAPTRTRPGLLLIALRVVIVVAAILALLQLWGLDLWSWLLAAGLGERLIAIAVAVGTIYLLWLGINSFIAGYIRRLEAQADPARSSTRTRTVLVLARNAIFVTLCLIGGLIVLSELGVNIAPLLAGAGVLGIAIGFGSQHLVQDVITGMFNLIEDTFAVGDVVDLGGKSGVIEAVTIRTVRLRDLEGNVHTIPFSAIGIVTNMTKDFAFAAWDIRVAYRENVDHVMQVITEVAEGLRRDRAYRRVILEPLEMLGISAFTDSAVIIQCRLKVHAASQWPVAREFRRRLKNRFDELGIEMPFPHHTLYFGQDRSGAAPPVRVVVESEDARENAQDAEAEAPPPLPRVADR